MIYPPGTHSHLDPGSMRTPKLQLVIFPLLVALLALLPVNPFGWLFDLGPYPTVTGHTAGQFTVNDAGAATYNIPITVSPGTGGIEPKLALTYNSQGGDGLLGIGWSLQGLSVISRSVQTLAQDGTVKGIDISRYDSYSLDGERLVPINGENGADGTEYRTEQNAFIRVISTGSRNGSPERFKVWTKSGLEMEYGYTASSNIEAQGTSKILFWLVSRVRDTKGNYYTVTYQEDNANGEYYPSRIDYTGNENTGLQTYASVQFFYEDRDLESFEFISGSRAKTRKLLTRVSAFYGTSIYREYYLDYTTSRYANTYLLNSVQECADGQCFEPTSFEWLEEKTFGYIEQPSNIIPTADLNGNQRVLFPGDWNADGMPDLLRYDAGSGSNKWFKKNTGFDYEVAGSDIVTPGQLTNGELQFGDFNSDGFTDFIWFNTNTRENRWFINSGDTTTLSFSQQNNLIPIADLPASTRLQFSDWNGDGLTDVLAYNQSSGYNKFFTNNFSAGGSLSFSPLDFFVTNSRIDGGEGVLLGDWNNDRLVDLLWYDKTDGSNEWYLNNGDSTYTGPFEDLIPTTDIDNGTKIDFGDFNGDGLSDLLWYDEANGQTVFYYNKGDFSFEKATHNLPTTPISGSSSSLFVIDFNGDGNSDIVYYRKSTGVNNWYLNNGHCDFSQALNLNQSGTPGYQNAIPTTAIDDGTTVLFGTYGDDSIIDLLWYDNANGSNRWFCNNIVRYNLLNAVTNGHGARTEIEYGSLLESPLYTRETSAVYPNLDMQARLPVVKAFTTEDGVGGRNRMMYCYKGAKADLHGRGFRGFAEIHMTDETTGITESKYYNRDYKYIAAPLDHSETKLADGTILNETFNTNGLTLFYNGMPKVHFSYVEESLTRSYEIDGSLITTQRARQEYDDYGNVTLSVVDYGDGHKDSTVNVYNNFVLNGEWKLGRLIRTDVYRVAPGQPTIQRSVAFEYDSQSGLLTKEITEPDLGWDQRIEKTYTHDGFGNIIESHVRAYNGSTIEDRVTYTTFSSNGRFTETVTNELGHTETRNFDIITGYLTSETGPNNLTSTYQYDGFGRKIREDFPDGNWVTYTYESCTGGCPPNAVYYVRQEASNTVPSTAYFDLLDRELCSETLSFDGTPVLVDRIFNHRGLVDRVSDPYFLGETPDWTVMTYDEIARETSQTLPGNRTMTTTYNGLVTSTTNPLNQTKTIITSPVGRNTQVLDNDNNSLTYSYDAQGNRTHVTDPDGNVIQMSYDLFGRKTQTVDPDLGTITYNYNQFDELLSELDAKGQVTELKYDSLGRLVQRLETEGTTTWIYDTQPNGVGMLSQVENSAGYAHSFTYDNLSRVLSETEVINGEAYTTSFTYDALGRIATMTYPTGFTVRHVYNQYFYLSEVRRLDNDQLIWRADSYNSQGQLLQATLGNGLVTTYTYDEVQDYLTDILTTDGVNDIQDLSFSFNDIGHLTSRSDNKRSLTENFQYDNLSRLTEASIVGGTSLSMQYDVLGNLTYKSDVGTYTYGENGAGPHAVTSIATVNSGVCIPSALVDYSYTSFDKVKTLVRGQNRLLIDYGADHQRIVQRQYKGDLLQRTKIHVGSHYEKDITDQLTKEIHYIRAGDGVVATYTMESNGLNKMHYWHKDHLGSLHVITDDMKGVTDEMSYDAWGKRRSPDWTPLPDPPSVFSDRGFTGHEHIDLFGLINMNGRVYDPVLGRFISPDPAIQDITDLQNLNRYSYVLNNPLSYTDPSGYFFKSLFKAIKKIVKSVFSFVKKHIVTIASIAIGVATGGAFLALAGLKLATLGGAFVSAAGFGFGSTVGGTLLSGGSFGDAIKSGLKAAVISGFTAVATFGVGSIAEKIASTSQIAAYGFKVVAHGVVQGVAEEARGGQFEHGFIAGAFSAGAGPFLDVTTEGNPGLSIIADAAIGGTAAELGGGKFANGAVSGAFIRIFNDLSPAHGGEGYEIDYASIAGDIALEVIPLFIPGGAIVKGAIWLTRGVKWGVRAFKGYKVYRTVKRAETFFEGAKFSSKVIRQMEKTDDLYHAFPKSVDGFATKFGKWTTQRGADGKTYQWLRMKGNYRGKTGTFEYTKDSKGVINHRFFNVTE